MEHPFKVIVPEENIEYIKMPFVKEILEQQRIILEMQKEIFKANGSSILRLS